MAKSKQSSKRRTSAQSRRSRKPEARALSGSATSGLPEAVVWGLLLARWLIPTEGTAGGDTLWLTSLTLAAAAWFCWWMSRVSIDRLRFGKLDTAVWTLCGAHILSALLVIVTEGNKRAATNMLWEWLTVAVLFSLIRQTLTPHSRTRFVQAVLVTTTALSCYGIWQPAYWYPSNLQEYERLCAERDAIDSRPDLSVTERISQRRSLDAEFVARGIPLSGPQQELFERRLRDSKEPLGFFALTNTFACFLASSLVMLTGLLLSWLLHSKGRTAAEIGQMRNRWLLVAISAAFLLLAYCLLLTKSRTAWGGALVGVVTLTGLLILRLKSGSAVKRLLPILAAGLVAITLLTGIAIATDALDVEVVNEAFMSLRYRLEYWTATWEVILDHPLTGSGPGNFRDHYLEHKLPESSEEIADPHQFVLDVTANAGVVGLLGLALFLATLLRMAWRICDPGQQEVSETDCHVTDSRVPSIAVSHAAIAIAGLVTLTGEWLFSGSISWQILCVVLLTVALNYLLSIVLKKAVSSTEGSDFKLEIPAVAIVAALVTIFVHLSAAGGIAMPAVIGLIFALAAVLGADTVDVASTTSKAGSPSDEGSAHHLSQAKSDSAPTNGSWLGAALFSGLAAVGCTMTAFVPVTQSTSLVQIGDYEAVNGQNAQRAVGLYRQAANADTLSPEPHIRLGQYYLRQWQQTHDAEYFEKSIENFHKAQSLSPNSPHIAHDIGYAWLAQATRSSPAGDETPFTSAVRELQTALAMYPTQPVWTAETAQALALSGKQSEARTMARRALNLDELNHNAGHIDRYLPDELLAEMQQLAGIE